MTEKQMKITQQFKNKKSISFISDISTSHKRQSSPIEDEKEFKYHFQFLNKKRILLNNLNSKQEIQSLDDQLNDSKSKNITSKPSINSSQDKKKSKGIQLSTKTKNILESVLNKKNNNINQSIKQQHKLLIHQNIILNNSPNSTKEKKYNIKINNKNPILSDKAKQILEKLKNDKQNKFILENKNEKNYYRSESAFSLRFKYEELIQERRELPLPMKYKNLFNLFCHLESILNLSKIKSNNSTNTFENIKNKIEESAHRRFDLKIFQQILYIVPHFYIYKYEKILKQNEKVEYDLIIDIPDDYSNRITIKYPSDFHFEEIQVPKDIFNCISKPLTLKENNDRKKFFKNVLIELTNKQHEEFLEKNKYKKINPFNEKTWHHKFDLQNCIDIPIFEILNKPNEVSVFHKFIEQNDIKNQIIDNVKENNDIIMNDNTKELSKYVSKEFISKLQAKQNAIEISKEIIEHNYYIHSTKNYEEISKEIINQIKSYLFVNSKESCEINELAEKIFNSSDKIKNSITKENIIKFIRKISMKYPNLMKLIKHSQIGNIVVMNMSELLPNQINIDLNDN